MSKYKFLTQGRGRYTAVRAKWWDTTKAERVYVQSTEKKGTTHSQGQEEVYWELPKTYPNEKEAQKAANAKMRALDDSECSLVFTTVGNPELLSSAEVTLKNFRPEVPTKWRLTKVDHMFSSKGYSTHCVAEVNFAAGSGGAAGGGQ